MTQRLLTRLAAALPPLFGATLIAFLLGVLAPGDPVLLALDQSGDGRVSPEAIATLRAAWGLDQPLPLQYFSWMGRVLRGDLGVSYVSGEPVGSELLQRLGPTLILAGSATALAALLGISAGVICALKADTWIDAALSRSSVVLASLPGYLLAILLIAWFAEGLRLVPTSGYGTPAHLLLPALALAVGEGARLLRLTRVQFIDVLAHDYVRTARAKGLAASVVAWRHALPNALIPVITSLGLYLGAILGGAAIVEVIFAWPGIGRLAIDSIRRQDYPVVQGFVLLTAAVYVVLNLLVDFCYGLLDPRIRSSY